MGRLSVRTLALAAVALIHVGAIAALMVAGDIVPLPEHPGALVMADISETANPQKPDQPPALAKMLSPDQVSAKVPQFDIAPTHSFAAAGEGAITLHHAAHTAGVPPRPISVSCAVPHYPAAARAMGESGAVTIALLVGRSGRVLDSRIRHSSGFTVLDKAAEAALAQCAFHPGTKAGRPVRSWTILRYVWSLDPQGG